MRDLPAERVEFLRWDSINSMSRLLRTPRPTTGYLCSWLNVACGRRGSRTTRYPLVLSLKSANALRSLIPPPRLTLSQLIESNIRLP